jgi:hypothetical protein
MMRGSVLVAAAVSLPLACAGRAPQPSPSSSLAGGEVARVADTVIPGSLLAEVARAKKVAPRAALDDLVVDALAAQGARMDRLDRDPAVAWACTVTPARRIAERALADARAAGLPADDEIAAVTVVHAVVLRGRGLSEDRGIELAMAIEKAVAGATSADDFEKRANGVPHPLARVIVERLAGFGADGRTSDGVDLDHTFVAAALALHVPGETSPIIETRFGWHVLRLIERAAPDGASIEARRRELVDAVVEMRARAHVDALLRAGRHRVRVDVASAAEALMAAAIASP